MHSPGEHSPTIILPPLLRLFPREHKVLWKRSSTIAGDASPGHPSLSLECSATMPGTTSMRDRRAKLQYLLLSLALLGSTLFYVASTAATLDGLIHYSSRARPPLAFHDDSR